MVREVGHFETSQEWEALKDLTDGADLEMRDEWEGCKAMVSIGDNSSSIYEAILTLKGIA